MSDIKAAIIGIGNCASALVQGRFFYANPESDVPGLITRVFGGYRVCDIQFVAAFDIDERKVGLDLGQAIFAPPNCTAVFHREVPKLNCPVQMGYIIDSIAAHNARYPEPVRFRPLANRFETAAQAKAEIVRVLRAAKAEVLINYLPVGSEQNSGFYAECAIEAGCAFVNAVPVFLSRTLGGQFKEAGLPILGDDVKSQVGATIVHRVLTKLFEDRGQPVRRTYQLNVGGNTDFLNMLDRSRLESKKRSKTDSVRSQTADHPIADCDIHIGPSDYIPWLNDNKVCFIRIEAEQFGGIPMNLELRLSVEDSPNSAGVIVDAVRAAKVALDRKLAGPIIEASAYLFKSPVKQFDDGEAREKLRRFAAGA